MSSRSKHRKCRRCGSEIITEEIMTYSGKKSSICLRCIKCDNEWKENIYRGDKSDLRIDDT